MGVEINLHESYLTVKFSGWTELVTFRKQVEIPYTSIVRARADYFKLPLTAKRRTGIATSRYKVGHFRVDKEKYFVTYRDRYKAVMLELNGHEFDKVIIQNSHPQQLAEEIKKRSLSRG